MTILELREARNKAWEGAKAFVESKRDKDGLLSKEDAETYNSMEEKIKNYFRKSSIVAVRPLADNGKVLLSVWELAAQKFN